MAKELHELVQQVNLELCSNAPDDPAKVLRRDGKRFVTVDDNLRESINVAELRKIILEPFSRGLKQRIVQVVGDSGTPISKDKLIYAQELLKNCIDINTVVEYGFTCAEHDVNWLVGNLTVTQPDLVSRLIGNIVQSSVQSMRDGWSGLESIQHLVLVYRKGSEQTSYGEDVWVSDGIMNVDAGDTMICFEGGLQALKQCVNALLMGVEVIAVTNIRQIESTNKFSAARLLAQILENQSTENVQDYLAQYPFLPDKQYKTILLEIDRLNAPELQLKGLSIEQPTV